MSTNDRAPKNPRAAWKPAGRLETFDKDPELGYRWCSDDPNNIERKQMEGWVPVNATTGINAKHNMEESPTSGAKKHNELVLMAATKETLDSRKAYHDKLNDRAARAIFEQGKQAAKNAGGEVTGKIIID